MTEKSYWWTTGGAGDGSTTYTRVDLLHVAAVLGGGSGFEGVVSDYLNELAGTVGGANTFNINTGGAIVDGKPYRNDASVGVNIPSTSSLERIDRVVLRAGWTAQTVRITRIAGTESASPTAPAITQTSQTTYDIMLYQVRVNSSGTVTVELDERVWAAIDVDDSTIELVGGQLRVKALGIDTTEIAADAITQPKIDALAVGTTEIANDAITQAKIDALAVDTTEIADDAITQAKIDALAVGTTELAADAVDDTKVGNRVPQFYRRQGGNATDWDIRGTTTYTPTAVRIQAGVGGAIFSAQNLGGVIITFPVAFSAPPIVIATIDERGAGGSRGLTIHVDSAAVSTTQVSLVAYTVDGTSFTGTVDVGWIAIGPE